MIAEFLFDHADNLISGKKAQFDSFNEYGNKYKKMEEEKRRKEQQQRQAEQQRQWEERFKQWGEYQSYQRGSSGYGSYGNGQYGNGQTYVNPTIEFKSKYEKSCDLLGINYNADKYEVKLGYRKKAKEYHPDINKSPDATTIFQDINNAYDFLSDDNIERYKSMR